MGQKEVLERIEHGEGAQRPEGEIFNVINGMSVGIIRLEGLGETMAIAIEGRALVHHRIGKLVDIPNLDALKSPEEILKLLRENTTLKIASMDSR